MLFKKTEAAKENFMSRKYHIVFFWNSLAAGSVAAQVGLSFFNIQVKLPLEIIVGLAGALSAGYMGVNIWEKKISGLQGAQDALVGTKVTTVQPASSATPETKK